MHESLNHKIRRISFTSSCYLVKPSQLYLNRNIDSSELMTSYQKIKGEMRICKVNKIIKCERYYYLYPRNLFLQMKLCSGFFYYSKKIAVISNLATKFELIGFISNQQPWLRPSWHLVKWLMILHHSQMTEGLWPLVSYFDPLIACFNSSSVE